MRFFEGGPSIPDALLASRDEGQVVFFCGAGVSRARANLPDFAGLAKAVADALGSSRYSPARKLLALATSESTCIDGIGGLLPTDRVFSLLEQEFEVEDVRHAVAQALRYTPSVDRSAHRILLDLARGPDGAVRLVTTNYDRLFEEEDPHAGYFVPPVLPRPNRPQEWSGIINLHGRLGDDFTAPPASQEFVLSSTDFGRAYLSDGWATAFIRGLMEPFKLVFVGYAADDPPVQYLLEALNGHSEGRLYAFQSGRPDVARALWSSKGVEAIAYSAGDQHQALWSTLEAWADRARSPEGWRKRLLRRAAEGPAALEPIERGQVKHLVSSAAGALAFLEASPPADWLCVFDPALRYRTPLRDAAGAIVWDPFDVFGLDDDDPPQRNANNEPIGHNGPPASAWSALVANAIDRSALDDWSVAAISGPRAINRTSLPRRLGRLAQWIGRVADDPVTPWWAASAGGLHPDIIRQVRLGRLQEASEAVRRAWSLIATHHEHARSDFDIHWFEFSKEIKSAGWSEAALLRWADLLAPRVTVQSVRGAPPRTLGEGEPLTWRGILGADVDYPDERDRPPLPNALLPLAANLVRRQIQDGLRLEAYARDFVYLNIPPIRPDPTIEGDTYSREYGISKLLFRYVELLQQLARTDPTLAMKETSTWPADELFDRLRIWAMGEWSFWPVADIAKQIRDMAGGHLWSMHGQRDLLLTLEARWPELSAIDRKVIISRLSRGPDDRDSDDGEAERRARKASASLTVLEWLTRKGCDLGPTYDTIKTRLRRAAPEWRPEWADNAANSYEGSGGIVSVDEDATVLEDAPLREILDRAAEAGGHDWGRLTERRPFSGLVKQRPARAFKALMTSAAAGEHPAWAWNDFFWDEGRKSDSKRLRTVIGERLALMSVDVLGTHLRAVTHWLQTASKGMPAPGGGWFSRLWDKVLDVLRTTPELGRSSMSGSSRMGWVAQALNSPGGDLAIALMEMDARLDEQAKALNAGWLARIESLLSIPGDVARSTSVMLLRNLGWFYHWAPDWSARWLLALLEGGEDDRDAFWDGLLSAGRPPPAGLYDRLSPKMIALAASQPSDDQAERLAGVLLSGWGSRRRNRSRYISDADMRELLIVAGDVFRSSILYNLNGRARTEPSWRKNLRYFLAHVWPRQRIAKTPRISGRLFDIAIESERGFARMVDLVVPLMTVVERDALFLFKVTRNKSWIEKQPVALLKLIYKALPRNTADWPYGAKEAVNRLGQQPAVAVDSRMIELRRRLAAQ